MAGPSVPAWTNSTLTIERILIVDSFVTRTRRAPASCSWRLVEVGRRAESAIATAPSCGSALGPSGSPAKMASPPRSRSGSAGQASIAGGGATPSTVSRGSLTGLVDRCRSACRLGRAGGDRGPSADVLELEALAAEFSRREIYPLSHHAVDALLAELGTARPSVRRERGPAYERYRPNELWHIDIKGPFFLQRAKGEYTKVWIVGLVDDHSRVPDRAARPAPAPDPRRSSPGSTTASSCAARRSS